MRKMSFGFVTKHFRLVTTAALLFVDRFMILMHQIVARREENWIQILVTTIYSILVLSLSGSRRAI